MRGRFPPLLLGVALGGVARAASEAVLPHFKWGQTKDKIFVTFAIRELEPSTVRVDFADEVLLFEAQDSAGKAYALRIELAQDVAPEGCHWSHLKRKDRWGEAVLATLLKRYPLAWQELVEEPSAAVRQAMDRDWAREDQALEQPEEDGFFSEHEKYLPRISDAALAAPGPDADVAVVAVRHAACGQCKLADDTFAAVAKKLSKAKAGSWKARVRLLLADPRSEGRALARRLGGRCASAPPACRFFAIAPPGLAGTSAPVPVRGRHTEEPLLDDLRRLARKQFQPIAAEDARSGRKNASRGLVVLPEAAPQELVRAAHLQRLRLDIAVAPAAEAAKLGLGTSDQESLAAALIWRAGEVEPSSFRPRQEPGGLDSFQAWLRARSVPVLADTSTFEEDEPYEDSGLPVARLFLNGSALDAEARAVVREVALAFTGKVAFIVRNATTKAYEWRTHGLPDGHFPAFAVAQSTQYNATKYAFLELTPRGEAAAGEFWRSSARPKLLKFLGDVLEGRLEASKMSEGLLEDGEEEGKLAPGSVRRLVGRHCRSVVEASETEVLIEAYDEWRRDHKARTLRTNLLAPMLAEWNITVFRLNLGYNECPADTLPAIPAGYSGYFFVHPRAKDRGRKWQKLKKHDAPFDRVLSFVVKHTQAAPRPNAEDLHRELEGRASAAERMEVARELGSDPRSWAAVVAGILGLLLFRFLRRRGRPVAAGAKFAPAAEPPGDGRPDQPQAAGSSSTRHRAAGPAAD